MARYLYAAGEPVNGHQRVRVSDGGPDEALWRSLGYVPEGERPAPPLADAPRADDPIPDEAVESVDAPVEAPAPKRRGRPRKAAK